MTYSYKWVKPLPDEDTGTPYQVLRTGGNDGTHLIDAKGNHPDAIDYRDWVEAGGVTEAAD
tara:strand:+ start:1262 stop:1444 length:183 start_codon:yes stop_codon:yes gene_type:complete